MTIKVSIHAPREGRDNTQADAQKPAVFQSTRPARGATPTR